MTTRKFNSLKKRLLEHGDLTALREILNDADAAEKINTDPELVAYIESQDNLVDLYDQILTDEEREAWHKALNNIMDLVAEITPFAKKASNLLGGFAETLSKARFDLLDPSWISNKLIDGLSEDVMRAHLDAWKEIEPYLEEILKRPEYKDLTLSELLIEKHTDESGNEYTLFQKVREEIEAEREKQERDKLPHGKHIRKGIMFNDAPNAVFMSGVYDTLWGKTAAEIAELNNQLTFNAKARSDKKNDHVLIYMAFSFDELPDEIKRAFSFFDYRVYTAICGIRKRGYLKTNITQISEMAGFGIPNGALTAKIRESIEKMSRVRLYYDNTEYYGSENYDDDRIIDYRYMLNAEIQERRSSKTKKLKEAEIILGILEPPLYRVAERKGQVFEIPVKALQTPLPKTDKNIILENYLIETIHNMKTGYRKSRDILYDTMLKAIGQTRRDERHYIINGNKKKPARLEVLLKHYQSINMIEGFNMKSDRVTIILPVKKIGDGDQDKGNVENNKGMQKKQSK